MKLYSPTQVSMYMRCPAQYRFRYGDDLKVPPPGYLLVGSAIHEAAELNGQQKIQSHADLPVSDLADAAAAAFDRRLGEEGILPDPDQHPGRLKDEAVTLTRVYREEIAPGVQPVAVERKFPPVSFDGVAYGFTGRIDLLDDKGRIHDLKSKSKTPSEIEPQDKFQLSAYAMAHEAEHGALPTECVNNSLVKLKEPKATRHAFQPTKEDVRLVLSTLAEVHQGIRAGAFPPNRSSFLCSKRTCGFAPFCEKAYGGKVRP